MKINIEQAFLDAKLGNTKELYELISLHPTLLSARDERGRTLLHIAAASANDPADTVQMLLSRGADQEAVDNDGWTAADWADFIVNPDVMLLLIGPGALG